MVLEKKGKKKVHGRVIDLVVVDKIKKKITPYGVSGAHITIPFRHLDQEANVEVLSLMPFVCEGCIETISLEKNFSPQDGLCMNCYNEHKEFEKWMKLPKSEKVCKICKKPLETDEFLACWSQPTHIDCLEKLEEDESEDN